MRAEDAGLWPQEPLASADATRELWLRIAVISAPRSGNTWLRNLLAATYSLPEIAAHEPEQVDWPALPSRVVLQIHWQPIDPYLRLIQEHGFKVVTLSRHPLDLFISLLNYRQYLDDPPHWDEGNGESTLIGASPRSAAFLDFACGRMTASLLSPTREWLRVPGTIGVRYEDLVADTPGTLGWVTQALSPDLRRPVAEVAPACSIDRVRSGYDVWHYHYWQGTPGLWKTLLTAREAQLIASAHAAAFAELDYRCDADPDLDETQADLNWFRLQYHSLRRHLTDERAKRRVTRGALDSRNADAQAQAATVLTSLAAPRAQHETPGSALPSTLSELEEGRQHASEAGTLRLFSLELTRTVQSFSRQHVRIASAFKQLIRTRRESA